MYYLGPSLTLLAATAAEVWRERFIRGHRLPMGAFRRFNAAFDQVIPFPWLMVTIMIDARMSFGHHPLPHVLRWCGWP